MSARKLLPWVTAFALVYGGGVTNPGIAHAVPPPVFRPAATAQQPSQPTSPPAGGASAATGPAAATPSTGQPAATPGNLPAQLPPPATPPTTPPPTTPTPNASGPPRVVEAGEALERARAAYEYGDIDEMVESARPVSDGRLHPTPAQRAFALRYLGIGLFLTGRPEGAETAFFELLRLRPESRLDPRTTRPDVVAFFEQVRARHAQPILEAARANNKKVFAWNFFPPAGQFQNGHRGLGFTLGGIELVSAATFVTTFALLKKWEGQGHTFGARYDEAKFTKNLHFISLAVLGGAVLFGIIDGVAHYADQPDEPASPESMRLSLGADGLSLSF